ncbi:glycosyltransferase [Subtercola frigoramans]|uniref:Glycosyltransferase involved in cell wall biosynthesis n=1 Tax=Subtercola frigoramans TaxID=120298 RepID=A0ABS2L005_9MICO|nr:glycosyltransferase [Subtercola frigoramans]MBM7470403.1 glycosyltransferase involved in cell wall biosynthesis [Subtercola frigoramans]
MTIDSALLKLHETPFLLDAMRYADEFAASADRFGDASIASLVEIISDGSDALAAITAVHALARIYDDEAEIALSNLLSSEHAFLREHAAWAFWSRLPRLDAISRLVAGIISGGFTGALSQRTLQQWATSTPDHIALAIEGSLASESEPGARARLAETLGLIPGRVAGRALAFLAADDTEHLVVRVAAMAALGDRNSENAALRVVQEFAETSGELGDVARLAAYDIELSLNPPLRPRMTGRRPSFGLADLGGRPRQGLTVAQLFLHADIDRGLTRAGAGDNGGIATLLVRLGDSLAREEAIGRVITMSRGSAAAALAALPGVSHDLAAENAALLPSSDNQNPAGQHLLVPIPLLAPPTSSATAWPTRIAAERGIRRALLALGPVDVLHLRMADVGSMAAATVAERLGIPVVFTLAPDPHGVIHALDMSGALTRASFGDVDEHEHYWFRTRLVQRLSLQAAHIVLFPRPDLPVALSELLGVDIQADPERYTVVPEGIDVSVIESALSEARNTGAGAAFTQLDDLIAALPPRRHGLPIALSVGRLHHVKGMATIVEAWASDPQLRAQSNLVIVGGDLAHPSTDEQGQLDRIAATLDAHPEARDGLVLAGHQPNDVVARWLAAVRLGRPGLIGAHGVYVCGSLKEEFGIALLEALAAGLVVLAPDGGGPATYVHRGVTGVLVDTKSATGIRLGMHEAFALAHVPDPDARPSVPRLDDAGATAESAADAARINEAQQLISGSFTVDAMAHALTGVYTGVAERSLRPLHSEFAL